MSMPFYVSPEQLMRDRADFARKGIARGRSLVAVQYADGLLFVAENQSQTLHKVSELYDRLAFAAVGRYNEFENLRIAGVRLADMRGYSYDRLDVTGRGLANAYAQTLGTIFSSGGEKPYEVELFVAELGDSPEGDQIYRLTYQGSIADEQQYAAMGGSAEHVAEYLKEHYQPGLVLDDALRLAVAALAHDDRDDDGTRQIGPEALEAAALERSRSQPRKFRRITAAYLSDLLGVTTVAATEDESQTETEPATPTSPQTPGQAGTQRIAAQTDESLVEPAAPAQPADSPDVVDSTGSADSAEPADSADPTDPASAVGELPDDSDSPARDV